MSREERHQEQRHRVLQAAAELIAADGYHGMTMRSLARRAGMGIAALYTYFPSKEEILLALHTEAFETLIASAREALERVDDPVARLYVFVSHHVRYFAEHPEVMRTLVYEASSLPPAKRRTVRRLKERYFAIGRAIVETLVASGTEARDGGRDEIELDRRTYSLFGMLNWIYGWYQPEVHGSSQELARTIHDLALAGLRGHGAFAAVQDEMEAHLAAVAAPPLLGHNRHGGERP